jgi:uncharacterized protein
MQNLFTHLTNEEMDQLGKFLLDRINEDDVTEGRDEGILDISTLDGFMTALVSGPSVIPPSQWLPAVWGEFEPEWESAKHFETILTLMMRHMNDIAGMLMEAPDEFEPIFMEREVDGKLYCIVDEWCEGYLRGMSLNSKPWSEVDGIETLLGTLLLFASEEGWEKLEGLPEDEVERHQRRIAPAVRRIHAYWLERREHERTNQRNESKTGRNDPCPCGSGKKYKKCCGSGPTLH